MFTSLYNSPPYGSTTTGKNTSGLQGSYLSSYTTPSSMTQYSTYATYNSGTTNFPNVAQNISSSSQVFVKRSMIIHIILLTNLKPFYFRNWTILRIAAAYTETTEYHYSIPDIIPCTVIMQRQPRSTSEI